MGLLPGHHDVPVGTLSLGVAIIVLHVLERRTRFAKLAQAGNFCGSSLMAGKVWVLATSSLLHGTPSHAVRMTSLLVVLGTVAERFLLDSPVALWALFFVCGAVGATCSWLLFRRSLARKDPEYGALHADFAWSRGASASVYGVAGFVFTMAAMSETEDHLGTLLDWGFGEPGVRVGLTMALFFGELFSRHSRLAQRPVLGMGLIVVAAALWSAVDCSSQMSVATMGLYLFGKTALTHAFPWLLYLERGLAAEDTDSHMIGAACGTACALGLGLGVRGRFIERPWAAAAPLATIVLSEFAIPPVRVWFDKRAEAKTKTKTGGGEVDEPASAAAHGADNSAGAGSGPGVGKKDD